MKTFKLINFALILLTLVLSACSAPAVTSTALPPVVGPNPTPEPTQVTEATIHIKIDFVCLTDGKYMPFTDECKTPGNSVVVEAEKEFLIRYGEWDFFSEDNRVDFAAQVHIPVFVEIYGIKCMLPAVAKPGANIDDPDFKCEEKAD